MARHRTESAAASTLTASSLPTASVVAISVASAAILLIIVIALATWLHRRRRRLSYHSAGSRRAKEQLYGRPQTRALKSPGTNCQTPPPLLVKKTTSSADSKTPSPESEQSVTPTAGGAHRQLSDVVATAAPLPDVTDSAGSRRDGAEQTADRQEVEPESQTEADGGKRSGLGQIVFSVRHDPERAVLVVTVNECRHLLARNSVGTTTDPYVKVQLLPGRQQRGKTRVMRNTLSPLFNEEFTFYGLQPEQIQDLTLHFVVLSFDRYSRDEILGEVIYSMSDAQTQQVEVTPQESGDPESGLEVGKGIQICMDIRPRSVKNLTQSRGELLVSLCFQPGASRLTAVVLKARNLPKMDITGSSDPYVKICLIHKDRRIAKKKTHVKKRTLNPVFNESFVFDLPEDCKDLSNTKLELMLLDWDRVTKNEVIGRLTLGDIETVISDDSRLEDKRLSTTVRHWKEIINSPRRQIAEWHKLVE